MNTKVSSSPDSTNLVDKLNIGSLVVCLLLFRPFIKLYYLNKKIYNPSVYNEKHVFFFRNGKRLIQKFKTILERHHYPDASLDYALFLEKIAEGFSFSRFGDGEYSIINGKLGSKVYFDRATRRGREQLIEVFGVSVEKHAIGLLRADVVARQLSFANAQSYFRKILTTGFKCRMPIFAEYTALMLSLYRSAADNDRVVFDTGIIRATKRRQHLQIWKDHDVLFVIGSIEQLTSRGMSAEFMFEGAKSFSVIETVPEYALSLHYDEILSKIVTHKNVKNKLIILSQGMAGTVLAYDLAKAGFQAIDFGQPFVHYRSRGEI